MALVELLASGGRKQRRGCNEGGETRRAEASGRVLPWLTARTSRTSRRAAEATCGAEARHLVVVAGGETRCDGEVVGKHGGLHG